MSEISVMPASPPVNHGAVLRQIAEKRQTGLSWQQIEFDLDLTRKVRVSYQWMAAAKLKAETPRLTWLAIARNVCVDLKESTLKTNHKSAVLPNGMGWDEYRAAFQSAMHARLTALQQAAGVTAAEKFFDGVVMLGEVVTGLVADLKEQRDNPPKLYGPGTFDKDGIENELQATEQLTFSFPGLEGTETVERRRRTLAFNTRLRMEAEGLARAQRIIGYLLTGKKIEDDTETGSTERPAASEATAQTYNEARTLVRELELYEQGAAA